MNFDDDDHHRPAVGVKRKAEEEARILEEKSKKNKLDEDAIDRSI